MLYVSFETFKKDKTVYIFETNSNAANRFSEQLSREIHTVNQSLVIYLDQFSKNGMLSTNADDELPESSILDGIQIFNLKNEGLILNKSSLKKHNSAFIETETPELKNAIYDTSKKSNEFFFLNDYLCFVKLFTLGENKYAVLFFYKSETINSFFNVQSYYKSFLVNSSGSVFLKDLSSDSNFLTLNFSQLFKNSNSPRLSSTYEIKANNKEAWLLTDSQTPLEDLRLILLVNEKKAFSALNEIVMKSVLIFIILFSVVTIVGVLSASYITNRLYILSEHTRKVSEGDFTTLIEAKGNDEVTDLTEHFNKMTIELKRLIIQTAHKARMEAELKTAQLVQETLFPKNEYSSEKIEINGHYQSASECGGDWWHYSENEYSVHFWIADATGHGASAALLTSAAKSSVAITEDMGLSPDENMKMLNKSICSVTKEKMMMTCFHAIYNKTTRILSYVNASHEPPVLFKKSEDNYNTTNIIFLNESLDHRLGYSIDTQFNATDCQLMKGDRIYFYTDGVQDVNNSEGVPLGEREFLRTLTRVLSEKSDLNDTNKNFIASLEKFRNQAELVDDVTFFFMETK